MTPSNDKITREPRDYWRPVAIPLEQRYEMIMQVMNSTRKFMTSRQIADSYINNPTTSDVLVTGSILNVLALANLVTKRQLNLPSKVTRYEYKLRGNNAK
jgi:hypothetical protein